MLTDQFTFLCRCGSAAGLLKQLLLKLRGGMADAAAAMMMIIVQKQ